LTARFLTNRRFDREMFHKQCVDQESVFASVSGLTSGSTLPVAKTLTSFFPGSARGTFDGVVPRRHRSRVRPRPDEPTSRGSSAAAIRAGTAGSCANWRSTAAPASGGCDLSSHGRTSRMGRLRSCSRYFGKGTRVRSLRRICLGVGMLAALLGHRFLPYQDSGAESAAEVGTQV